MSTLESPTIVSQKLAVAHKDGMLEATVSHPSDNMLCLRYRVKNDSNQPMYLCNKLYKNIKRSFETDEVLFEVQPNLVSIQVATDSVLISKKVVDVPDWVVVEALQIPCLSRVMPGEEWEETVVLSLPLMPYTVYEYSPATGPISLRSLFFELGYFLASPYTERFISAIHTSDGPAYYIDPFPVSDQSIFALGPFSAMPVIYNQ